MPVRTTGGDEGFPSRLQQSERTFSSALPSPDLMRTLRRLAVLHLALASALSAQGRAPEPTRPIDWAAIEREGATLMRDYLRVNTTNPPGNELAAARFLRDFLAKEVIEAQILDTATLAPGRANLYARVPQLDPTADEPALRKRLTQLEALYKTTNKVAPEYPAETQTDKTIDWNARTSWIEARLLEGMQPDQPTLEALARQRAQAVQSAVLTNTGVAPERVFITTERGASLKDGQVRMELKLE